MTTTAGTPTARHAPTVTAPTSERDPGEAVGRQAGGEPAADRRAHVPLRVAYVMSRFPKLSETFILHEILEVERAGIDVAIHPLLREPATVVHPDVVPLVARARFLPFLSRRIVRTQLAFLRSRPRRYLRALLDVIAATWRRPRALAQTLAIFPKVVEHARLMEAAGVEHVHCHFANHPAMAGYVIRRLTGIPYSFTGHAYELEMERDSLPLKVRHAAFVVAISEFNRRIILEACGGLWNDKIRVIHCGVDTDRFRPAGHRETSPALTLLSVGRLEPVKGHPYLVDAVRRLREEGVDVRCRIAGEGSLRPELERQITAAGLGDAVELLGPRTAGEVVGLMADADVFVLPSVVTPEGRREGIPVVLMEAMSTGLAVVSTRTSGIPELVHDSRDGLLVAPRDPAALADAIRRLHDDAGLRARLGAAGRATVGDAFDLGVNARALADGFRAAARRPAAVAR